MKNFPVNTCIGLCLQLASCLLIYFKQETASRICALLGLLLATQDLPKFSSWFQYILVWTGSIILGQSLELGNGHIPLLTISVFVCVTAMQFRTVFYTTFIHTRVLWLDPSLLIASITIFVYANISQPIGWQGWVFPSPAFAFGILLISGFVQEGLGYKKESKNGYKVAIGKQAPDFTLPDQNGAMVSLLMFMNKRHILLLFVRGDWCPACHMMLRAYEKGKEKFQEKNVYLIAVGPDPSGVNREMSERIGVDFCILADEGQRIASKYGVCMDKDPVNNPLRRNPNEGLPLPASFLICDKGIVRYHSSPERVGEFLEPYLIFDVLKKI